MKKLRLLQYHARRLLLGADPEALFFALAAAMVLLGIGFSSTNILVLTGSFFLAIYGAALALWLREKYG